MGSREAQWSREALLGALALCVCVFEGAHQMASASLRRVWSLHHHHWSAGTTQKPQILGKSLANLPHIPASIVRLLKSLANPFQIVKDQKTDEGLDLTSSRTILKHLAKWCDRMCKEHSIDPGSEAMQALLQQAHWHEENKEDHVRTRDAVEKAANDVMDAQVATHATVEDIARFLGVGMDGMDENHRKTHAKLAAFGVGKVHVCS